MRHEVREVVAKAALPVFLLTGSLAVGACGQDEAPDAYEEMFGESGNDSGEAPSEQTTTTEQLAPAVEPELPLATASTQDQIAALFANEANAKNHGEPELLEFYFSPSVITGVDQFGERDYYESVVDTVAQTAEYQRAHPDFAFSYDFDIVSEETVGTVKRVVVSTSETINYAPEDGGVQTNNYTEEFTLERVSLPVVGENGQEEVHDLMLIVNREEL